MRSSASTLDAALKDYGVDQNGDDTNTTNNRVQCVGISDPGPDELIHGVTASADRELTL